MAESWFMRGEGGSVIKMDLPFPDPIRKRVDAGLIVRVNEDGSDWVEDADAQSKPEPVADTVEDPAEEAAEDVSDTGEVDDMDEAAPNVDKPNQGAPKAVWVDWAVLVSDLTVDEAKALTKAELIERFG